jgi:LysR family carnitine catabolism transcriptional activator
MSTHPNRAFDIEELRTFCSAAELGSLGRAAIRLHVSQPGLSKRLSHLETAAGIRLFDRGPHGVKLTQPGRRLYEEARRVLQQADHFEEVLLGLKRLGGPVRVAASHSATEALVAGTLAQEGHGHLVELLIANSTVVRDLVADGRADLGIAASRPNHTPYPGVRELELAQDAIVCAVPPTHRWAKHRRISTETFQGTPMVMRDAGSNARWTVDAVLREHELSPPPALVEASTPQAAIREARTRNAPVLLSHQVLVGADFHEVQIAGLAFPRKYVLLLPAYGEPSERVSDLMDELRHQATIWFRPHQHTEAA